MRPEKASATVGMLGPEDPEVYGRSQQNKNSYSQNKQWPKNIKIIN